MARNGSSDDPSDYSDATQYADYGGTGGQAYSEYDGPAYDLPPAGYGPPTTGHGPYAAPIPPAWYQRPVALVGLGALTAALLALLIYAIVKFTSAESHTETPVSSTTSAAPGPNATNAPPVKEPDYTVAPVPSANEAPTATVTETTVAPAPTTTQAPAPTSTTVAPTVTTVTETTTKHLFPFPLPTRPRPQEPVPGG